KLLDESDIKLLQAYDLKINNRLSNSTFEKIRYISSPDSVDSLKQCQSRIERLSGFKPIRYDCCPSSCVCYTGPHENLAKCPFCGLDRHDQDGRPTSYFEYLPITPRLHAMVAN